MLTPILFFLIFATVQFALYFFARHVALATAQEGDRVARAEAGNPTLYADWIGDVAKKENAWVNQLAPNLLDGFKPKPPTLTGQAGQDGWTVSVTVTAQVPSLIPGVQMSVSQTSVGPVEQFIPDN